MSDIQANKGKELGIATTGAHYVRLPIKTRLITAGDDLMTLLREYAAPLLKPDDMLFVSEKIVCITQNRIVPIADIRTSLLARILSKRVRNHVGTPQFRGYGHGTAPAMQLLIEEAGSARTIFAAAVSAVTRPLGIKGAFYYLVGKQAKSIDCPMSYTIAPYTEYAKRAPLNPHGVAKAIKDAFGIDAAIVDANYRGAFSLGKSTQAISERFIREVLRDNPAGQDSEMTPFLIIRKTFV